LDTQGIDGAARDMTREARGLTGGMDANANLLGLRHPTELGGEGDAAGALAKIGGDYTDMSGEEPGSRMGSKSKDNYC
jgi:hypothetical protein